jgi:hypothetical protein
MAIWHSAFLVDETSRIPEFRGNWGSEREREREREGGLRRLGRLKK